MAVADHDRLDQLDQFIRHIRPIEVLFQLMGKVGADTAGADLARGYSEIGLVLTGQLRECLGHWRAGGEPGPASTVDL